MMFWRWLTVVTCLGLGELIGDCAAYYLNFSNGRWVGTVIGALVWLAVDTSRATQMLQWLRSDNHNEGGSDVGLWGNIASRVKRLLRDKDRQIFDSQSKLTDFLSALQASPNGVLLLDSESCIEWCNQTAASHFGLDPLRDLLQKIGNLVRDPGFVGYLSGRDYGREQIMPGRNSTPSRPVNLSVQLFPYGQGRLLLLSRDITALEQAEAMRRDFVANVSHEIRTPLTVLAGFVETLQTLELQQQERDRYLSLMSQQADRMQTLVSDLLTLSRLEGGPPPGFDTWFSMSDLLHQIQQDGLALDQVILSKHQVAHKLAFECDFDGQISGVGSELLSAMGNLVSNAIRYTPPGASIVIRALSLPDGRVEFSVVDAGVGIAPEHIGRLTERFYRVDRSRSRETGGTGLGLAIVKHVAQRHGGELSIESTLGKGSVFKITFPASRIRTKGQLG
jgi:two-component system phosphate regulon sensor histidine kinase PhoR